MNDGGPAFPYIKIEQRGDSAYNAPTRVHGPGMSLRDWLAGQALTALLANPNYVKSDECDFECPPKCAVHDAYVYADAMLAARGKEAGDD